MGEVYRASDLRLHRDVAIKLLRPAGGDRSHAARFEQEGRVLASLNHPHIAHIHGFETADGRTFLVLELVAGESLDRRIARGPLRVDAAIDIARQIAEALDAAHEQGIVHRDLKPTNVMITTDDRVKLLDFGVAKVFGESASSAETIAAHTQAGALVGTTAYMSPEQARGESIDKRVDVWAFGCVLFEMLTATPAFAGGTTADVLAAVLNSEPDWTRLPATTPTVVRQVMRRCLEKRRRRRLRDIGDALLDLESTGQSSSKVKSAAPSRWLALAIPVVAAAAFVGGAAWSRRQASRPAATIASTDTGRFSIALPDNEPLGSLETPSVAISPDGRRVAFVAGSSTPRLFVRELDQPSARMLAGTTGASSPFFSPDGRAIAFFSAGRLNRVSTDGGDVITVCVCASNPRGGAWSVDGTIAFAPVPGGALMRVNATGGEAQPLTSLDVSRREGAHHWPEFLPRRDTILYTVGTPTAASWDERDIMVESLTTHERRVVAQGSSARYVAPGYLLIARAGTLTATAFDLDTLATTGAPTRLADGVMQSELGGAHFSVSASGTLVFVPGGQNARELVWVTRNGVVEPLPIAPQTFWSVRISPDGSRLALGIESASYGVWVYDLARGIMTRQTFQGTAAYPIWTPDGKRLTFNATQSGGVLNLFWRAVNASTEPERLTAGAGIQVPNSWSPDGRTLAYYEASPTTRRDIWLWSRDERKSTPWLQTPYDEGGAMFSHDGRWLAYVSTESGAANVYVRSFPGAAQTVQISNDGGGGPVWSANDRELFYREANGRMMAVDVDPSGTLRAGKPHALFEAIRGTPIFQADYDVTSDGQRFILFRPPRLAKPVTHLEIAIHGVHGTP